MKLSTLAALLCLPMLSIGQAGTLNTQFAGGVQTTVFGSGNSLAEDLAVQPDGKIIAAGQTLVNGISNIALARFNTNGTLDNSFGTGGKLTLNLNAAGSWLTAVAIQSDGKIIAGGSVANSGGQVDFVLMRLLGNGSFDPSFGTNGITITNVDVYSYLKDLLIQPDGKIIAAGEATDLSSSDVAVVRYLANGSPDLSFAGGAAIFDILGDDYVKSVKFLPGGKIIVGGSSNFMFSMARLNSNGMLDENFGNGGKLTTVVGSVPGNDNLLALDLQADGKIIAAGEGTNASTGSDIVVARFNNNGQLDNSFANNGLYMADLGGSFDQVSGVAVLNNGKILISGNTSAGGQQKIFIARLSAIGSLDVSFGTSGQTIVAVGSEAYTYAMALKGLQIYLAGVEMNAPHKMMVASFNNDAVALPVRFSSFTVQKQGAQILLKWQTEFEEHTKSFIAEKSSDGRTFTAFAELAASGSSTTTTEYRTIDQTPFTDVTYYRIRSTDLDGATSYTKILSIKNDLEQIEISPNPARSFSQVQFPTGINELLVIELFDLNGRKINSSKLTLNGSALSFPINLSGLIAGSYIIRIKGEKINFSQKILKE